MEGAVQQLVLCNPPTQHDGARKRKRAMRKGKRRRQSLRPADWCHLVVKAMLRGLQNRVGESL